VGGEHGTNSDTVYMSADYNEMQVTKSVSEYGVHTMLDTVHNMLDTVHRLT